MFDLTKLALLWEWVGELKNNVALLLSEVGPTGENLLPSRFTATTGQILKLTGENKTPSWADEYNYTPPAYSETEVNTGQKWINGKDVYCCVYSGDIGEQTSAFTLVYFSGVSIIPISTLGYISNSDNSIYMFISRLDTAYTSNNGRLYSASIPVTYSQGHYNLIIYYTKPDPTPGDAKGPEVVGATPDEMKELEAEEKKTTKKKTTK